MSPNIEAGFALAVFFAVLHCVGRLALWAMFRLMGKPDPLGEGEDE